jgi:hypothetical protein
VNAPSTFYTKTDANLFLSSVQADMARGSYIDPRAGKVTLAAWSAQWLSLPGKRPPAAERDRIGLAPFLETIGAVPLASLTPQ